MLSIMYILVSTYITKYDYNYCRWVMCVLYQQTRHTTTPLRNSKNTHHHQNIRQNITKVATDQLTHMWISTPGYSTFGTAAWKGQP
jgi:hypothetical protein